MGRKNLFHDLMETMGAPAITSVLGEDVILENADTGRKLTLEKGACFTRLEELQSGELVIQGGDSKTRRPILVVIEKSLTGGIFPFTHVHRFVNGAADGIETTVRYRITKLISDETSAWKFYCG